MILAQKTDRTHDERYEQEASRKVLFSKLYEASKQTKSPWVFEPEYREKAEYLMEEQEIPSFKQSVLIGKSYLSNVFLTSQRKCILDTPISRYERVNGGSSRTNQSCQEEAFSLVKRYFEIGMQGPLKKHILY